MSDEEPDAKFQIQARGPREEDKKVRLDYSLRAFCAVMFLEPRMKVIIRGKAVRPVRVATELQDMQTKKIKVEHAIARSASRVPLFDSQIILAVAWRATCGSLCRSTDSS